MEIALASGCSPGASRSRPTGLFLPMLRDNSPRDEKARESPALDARVDWPGTHGRSCDCRTPTSRTAVQSALRPIVEGPIRTAGRPSAGSLPSRAGAERSPDQSRQLSPAEGLRHPDGQQLPHQCLRKGLVDREVQRPPRGRVAPELLAELGDHRSAVGQIAEVVLEGGEPGDGLAPEL